MRIIVTGGRDYDDPDTVHRVLDWYAPCTLVHGACKVFKITSDGGLLPYQLRRSEKPGVDRLAHEHALRRGWEIAPYPADWRRRGRAAGPIRNRAMAAAGADLVLAFPGGRGTADMVRCARAAGIPVHFPAHDF